MKTFDLRYLSGCPFRFSIVVSGLNTQHTKIMASYLHQQVELSFQIQALNREGEKTGEWIILDYRELIVHIFYDYTREYYNLEKLWIK